jgi:hypothetical protein
VFNYSQWPRGGAGRLYGSALKDGTRAAFALLDSVVVRRLLAWAATGASVMPTDCSSLLRIEPYARRRNTSNHAMTHDSDGSCFVCAASTRTAKPMLMGAGKGPVR